MCKPIYEGEKAKAFLSLFENDKTLQKIAKLVYVDGLTYEKVGMIVGYSERQICRLCRKIKQIASESEVEAELPNTADTVQMKIESEVQGE